MHTLKLQKIMVQYWHGILNTVSNAAEFLKATTPGDDTPVVNPPDDTPVVNPPVVNPPIVANPVTQTIDLGKATVTLDKTTYTYDGETKVPAVIVALEGKTLKASKDYIITYANTTNAGRASVTIMGTGDYTGTIVKEYTIEQHSNAIKVTTEYTKTASTKTQEITLGAKATGGQLNYKSDNSKVTVSSNGKVTITANFSGKAVITVTAGDTNYKTVSLKVTIIVNPAKVKLSTVKNSKSGKLTVEWQKNDNVTGYEVQYSTTKSFADKTTNSIIVSSYQSVSKTISKLTGNKTYYVRVRTYTTQSTTKYYSAWSNVKSVKVKK